MLSRKINRTLPAFLAGLFLAAAVPVYSDCCDPCNQYSTWGTFYTGAGVDFSGATNKETAFIDDYDPAAPDAPFLAISGDSKYSGAWQPFGTLYLGYLSPNWCHFNFALEAFVSAAPKLQSEAYTLRRVRYNTSGELTANSLSSSYQDMYLNSLWGVSFLPGYQVKSDIVAYGSLGYARARGELRQASFALGDASVVGIPSVLDTYDERKSKTLNVFQAGLGFDIRTSEHLSVKFGYNFSRYDSLKLVFTVTDPETGEFIVRGTKIEPRTESLTASVFYHFTPMDAYNPGCQSSAGGEFYVGVVADRENCFYRDLYHESNPRDPALLDPVPGYLNVLATNTPSGKGWGGEVFVGYGYTLCCQAYLGVEGFYNFGENSAQRTQFQLTPPDVASSHAGTTTSSIFKVQAKNSYGLTFVPGYKFSDHLLIFAKLGVVERKLHLKTAQDSIPPGLPRDSFLENRVANRNMLGYQIGGGFDMQLCNNLYLRNEYVYTQYSQKKLRRNTTPLVSAGGFIDSDDRSLKVQSGQYKLGLIYKIPACCK